MQTAPRTPQQTYGPALQKARLDLAHQNPQELAMRAKVSYEPADDCHGRFRIPFSDAFYEIQWPEGAVRHALDPSEPDIATSILLLHYLLTADGTPLCDRWIAFRNLPGGLGYEPAFQRRASHRLARTFGSHPEKFERAAQQLGGERLTFPDVSFLFRMLPRVWLAVVLHLADVEFPAAANILFDQNASHYLPTEDLAVLAGMLASRLIRSAEAS